jgi:hypothetical protein
MKDSSRLGRTDPDELVAAVFEREDPHEASGAALGSLLSHTARAALVVTSPSTPLGPVVSACAVRLSWCAQGARRLVVLHPDLVEQDTEFVGTVPVRILHPAEVRNILDEARRLGAEEIILLRRSPQSLLHLDEEVAGLADDAGRVSMAVRRVDFCPSARLEALHPADRERVCAGYDLLVRPAPSDEWERAEDWAEARVSRPVVLPGWTDSDDRELPHPTLTRLRPVPTGPEIDAGTLGLLLAAAPMLALVRGPEGSGRTTLLRRLSAAAGDGAVVVSIAGRLGQWDVERHEEVEGAGLARLLLHERLVVSAGRSATLATLLGEGRRVVVVIDDLDATLDPSREGHAERTLGSLAGLLDLGCSVATSVMYDGLDRGPWAVLGRGLSRLLRGLVGPHVLRVFDVTPLSAVSRSILVRRFVEQQASHGVIPPALVEPYVAEACAWFDALPDHPEAAALASAPAWVLLGAAQIVAHGPRRPRDPGRPIDRSLLARRFILDECLRVSAEPQAVLAALEEVAAADFARRHNLPEPASPGPEAYEPLRELAFVRHEDAIGDGRPWCWHEVFSRLLLRSWVRRQIVRPLQEEIARDVEVPAVFVPRCVTSHAGVKEDAHTTLLSQLDPAASPTMLVLFAPPGDGKSTLLEHALHARDAVPSDGVMVPLLDVMREWPAEDTTPGHAALLAERHLARLLGPRVIPGAFAYLRATHRVLVLADGFPAESRGDSSRRVNQVALSLGALVRVGVSVAMAASDELQRALSTVQCVGDDIHVLSFVPLDAVARERLIDGRLEAAGVAVAPERRADLIRWFATLDASMPSREPVTGSPWWVGQAAAALAGGGFEKGYPRPSERNPYRVILDEALSAATAHAGSLHAEAEDLLLEAARGELVLRDDVPADAPSVLALLLALDMVRRDPAHQAERRVHCATDDLRGVVLARGLTRKVDDLAFDLGNRLEWSRVWSASKQCRALDVADQMLALERGLCRDQAVPAEAVPRYAAIFAHIILVHHLHVATEPDAEFVVWANRRYETYLKRVGAASTLERSELLNLVAALRETALLLDLCGGRPQRVPPLIDLLHGNPTTAEALTDVLVGFYGDAERAIKDTVRHLGSDAYRVFHLLNVCEAELLLRHRGTSVRLAVIEAAVDAVRTLTSHGALDERTWHTCYRCIDAAFVARAHHLARATQDVSADRTRHS